MILDILLPAAVSWILYAGASLRALQYVIVGNIGDAILSDYGWSYLTVSHGEKCPTGAAGLGYLPRHGKPLCGQVSRRRWMLWKKRFAELRLALKLAEGTRQCAACAFTAMERLDSCFHNGGSTN